MQKCFVIQPFDAGKFDKRYEDVYKPSIEAAGLEPYRVDRDPGVEVPIEAIESGIRNASICLADITTDNPNVWYELGFAFAARRPVVMICSEERADRKFPFDIQHRTIILYKSEAPSDFQTLGSSITTRIKAILEKGETLRQIAETEQLAPVEGLSQPELVVLAALAGSINQPEGSVYLWTLKDAVENAGFTSLGFSLGFRRLKAKDFIALVEIENENGERFDAAKLTTDGWEWIERNESEFVIRRDQKKSPEADPFA